MASIVANAMRLVPAARSVAARQLSTAAGPKYGRTWQKIWFGDKGAYPVMAVCVGAVMLCSTFIVRKVFVHPDVRMSSQRRNAVIRDWGHQ